MSDFDIRNVGVGGVTGGAANELMDFARIKQVLQRGQVAQGEMDKAREAAFGLSDGSLVAGRAGDSFESLAARATNATGAHPTAAQLRAANAGVQTIRDGDIVRMPPGFSVPVAPSAIRSMKNR